MCIMLLKSYPPLSFCLFLWKEEASHGDSVFQLIPKVAGPEAELLRVGWGQTQAA